MLLVGVGFVGAVAISVAALWPIHATTGWIDQQGFHMPTILGFAGQLPAVDIVNVRTATGPLYHLTMAVPMRLFGLSPEAIQLVGGLTYWLLTAAVVLAAARRMPGSGRAAVLVVVMASPYVWQSTLWAATDAATLVLCLGALLLLTRQHSSLPAAVLAGLAISAAVATRQTAAWLLLPALAVAVQRPTWRLRAATVVLTTAPALAMLAVLVLSWGGLTPPAFQASNGAGANPAGVPVGFALWAFFAVPLLLVARPVLSRRDLGRAAVAGSLAAAPALIWRSDYLDDPPVREGGWLWMLVRATGAIIDRSPLLVALAFAGGATVWLLLSHLHRAGQRDRSWVLGAAVIGAVFAGAAAANAWPKYQEIPLLACFTMLAAVMWETRAPTSLRWTWLYAVAAVQVVALVAITGAKVAAALL